MKTIFTGRVLRVITLIFLLALWGGSVYAASQKDQGPQSEAAGIQGGPVRLRLAVQPGDIQPYVAQKLGYFEEDGIDVELISFSYGPPIIEAFTSKSVDFGLVGDLPAYSGIANGIDITIIGTYSTSETQNGLIARNAANIKKLEDLKGKRVSVPFGSNSQPLLYLYLERAGLKDTDVEIINLSVTDSVASLVAGRIDAAVVWEPHLSTATKPGSGISELFSAEGFKLFVNPIIARGEFIAQYPEQTAKLLKVLNRAGIWAKEHQDEAAKIVADATEIDIEAVKINIRKRGLDPNLSTNRIDALILGAAQSFKYGLLTQKIDVAAHIDVSYLKAAGIQ
jgi:aliphatic sulfonates family ABC transporter substrate-binding protein